MRHCIHNVHDRPNACADCAHIGAHNLSYCCSNASTHSTHCSAYSSTHCTRVLGSPSRRRGIVKPVLEGPPATDAKMRRGCSRRFFLLFSFGGKSVVV